MKIVRFSPMSPDGLIFFHNAAAISKNIRQMPHEWEITEMVVESDCFTLVKVMQGNQVDPFIGPIIQDCPNLFMLWLAGWEIFLQELL
ncbi:hypothetical protein RJT34_33494 [Clitoria ternatea]|uniref:Uncharacterized protein n=1 Tax=Clitoria ternatea TaxID=43366 RepID=A0AAN9I6V9_CLITE